MGRQGYLLRSLPVFVVLGCSRADDGTADTTRRASGEVGAAATPVVDPPAPPRDTVVPQPLHWDRATLETTLQTAGLAPVPATLRGPDPFPNVTAASYRIGEVELRAYFFGDPLAAGRALSRPGAPRPAGTGFTSNNMVVSLRGGSEELRSHIRRILTAPEVQGGVNR